MDRCEEALPVIEKIHGPIPVKRAVRCNEPLQDVAILPAGVEPDLGYFGEDRTHCVRR